MARLRICWENWCMMKNNQIKKILYNNPFAEARRKAMRSRLKNTSMTFLAPSCIGGILFHDLGLQFRSPTVNLMMFQPDFVKLVTRWDEYSSYDFQFYDDPQFKDIPCARLNDITIHFTHYKTPEEAVSKWRERESRMDWDNTFIFCSDKDSISREEIEELGKMNVRGILVMTAKRDWADIPYVLFVPECEKWGEMHDLQGIHYISGYRNYEKYFDWVKWFNEANGRPYDVKPYSLI